MPRPGFGPPPGGPRGFGGPHGPWGGGPRGFGGGFGGPRGPWIPARPAPGGYVATNNESITDTLVDMELGTRFTFSHAIRRNGIIGGIACGIRKLTSGGLRHNSYISKLSLYDKQFAENRITKEQCLRRKMQAAKKYNGYLLKCGYYNLLDYQEAMNSFADSIGVDYIDDVHQQDYGRQR